MSIYTKHSVDKVYLVAGKRTPFGKFGGSLAEITPVDLSVVCSKELLKEVSIRPDLIDQVIFANVVPSSTDTMYGGRHLALKVGSGDKTPGIVINRLCGSGIQAILDAAKLIRLNEASCILVSGSENMSMVPHLVYGSRFGTKYGQLKTVDMLLDALTDQYANISMGLTAEKLANEFNVTRDEADNFSYKSHQKSKQAYEKGHFKNEISPVQLKRSLLERDEHLRWDASLEEMKTLRPTFQKDGVVTAASASGIVDGAASVIIASETFCNKNGLTPIAEVCDGAVVGVDPTKMGIGPVPAIKAIIEKGNLNMSQLDFIEINEAFAAQTLSCVKSLKLPEEKLNVWGGAVALGHPLGASGVRISLTLARQLKVLDGKMGIASACIGGGMGIAVLLKRVQ